MESNVLTRLNRVAARQTVTLTHYGRKSGKPYDVTIWFVVEGDKIYIGTANVNRQWVRNVQKTPQVKLSIGDETFNGTARFLTDRAEHERAMAAIRKPTSSSSNFVPDDDLKLVPALRPYIHQITGVVWAASWRWDIRKGIFHDFLFPILAGGTENVSFQEPVSFGLGPVAHSDCVGDPLRAVQPAAQFLGAVVEDYSDLIFTTMVVRHVFSPDVFCP